MMTSSISKQASKQASKLLSGVALTFALVNSANASTLNIATDGTLMGASGVSVNGTLYDVTFGDDTVANSVTAFTTNADAVAASKALIDQVLVGDYATYNSTNLINGCSANGNNNAQCIIYTGYSTYTSRGTPAVYASLATQNDGSTSNNFGSGTLIRDSSYPFITIAKWTVSTTATAVPEPEAYAMMLAGLGLVGFAAHRKQKTA